MDVAREMLRGNQILPWKTANGADGWTGLKRGNKGYGMRPLSKYHEMTMEKGRRFSNLKATPENITDGIPLHRTGRVGRINRGHALTVTKPGGVRHGLCVVAAVPCRIF